jgi:uncharacterized protein
MLAGGMLAAASAQALLTPGVFGSWGTTGGFSLTVGGALVAGSLVGFGTGLGSGCTSGHGVCGIPRMSIRSIVAVSTFMTTGMLTASVVDKVPTLRKWVFGDGSTPTLTDTSFPWMPYVLAAGAAGLVVDTLVRASHARHALTLFKKTDDVTDEEVETFKALETATPAALALAWGTGAAFSYGLGLSGMTNPDKVLGFLRPLQAAGWDLSLAMVMGGAVAVNLVAFPEIFKLHNPLLGTKFHVPTSKHISYSLVLGSALFGVGWGLAGFCPGPAIVSSASGGLHSLAVVAAMVGGMFLHRLVAHMLPHGF